MHQTNPGTLVRITIKDFGLAPAISTANLLNIFPGATIGGQGSGRWVEAPVLTIKTKEIKQVLPLSSATTANTITLGNSTGFSSRGLWTTKVSVFSGTNSCWGTVVIEDKLPPVITGPEDRTVSCLLSTLDQRGNPAVSVTGDADATGSCTDVIKKGYFDEVTESKCTPQSLVLKQIRRIFIVENPNGMQARDTQLITVLAVNLFTEMQCPEPLVLIKCDTDASPSGIAAYYKANPDPLAPGDSIKAWPYVIDAATGARYYLPENKSVCNLQ
jgi:hypothetical protein